MNEPPNAREIREQQEATDCLAEQLFSEGLLDHSTLRIDVVNPGTPVAVSVASFHFSRELDGRSVGCWVRGSLEAPLLRLRDYEPPQVVSVVVVGRGGGERVSDAVAANLFTGLVGLHRGRDLLHPLEFELQPAEPAAPHNPDPEGLAPLAQFRLVDQFLLEIRSIPPDCWEIVNREVQGAVSINETVLKIFGNGEDETSIELIRSVAAPGTSSQESAVPPAYRLELRGCRLSEFIEARLGESDIEALFLSVRASLRRGIPLSERWNIRRRL